jgi:nucleotide-binding universal stress UspA family protein
MAVRVARNLAGHSNAKVYVTHVLSPGSEDPDLAESLRASATGELGRIEREAMLAGVKHEYVLRKGDLWEELSRLLRQYRIDLIVMGSHGRSGFSKPALGSVAEEIFHSAPCPVITVGPTIASECAADADLRTILFPTDFSPSSLRALPYALSLAQVHHAMLVLLHVLELQTMELHIKEKAQELPFGSLEAARARAGAQLHKLVPADAELWGEPECRVESGAIAETILETAVSGRANLIVLGLSPEPGFADRASWEIASTIVSQAPCPVLTVRS